MKRKLKNELGITLIALIITIIILVILTAISIRAVYNMQIVGQASNGVQQYTEKSVEENRTLAGLGDFIDKAVTDLNNIELEFLPGLYNGSEFIPWDKLLDAGYLIDTNGVLTSNYIYYNFNYINTSDEILEGRLVVDESITEIGRNGLARLGKLTSVVLPESIKSIDYGAFSQCTRLTSITIPGGVTAIGAEAFYNCIGLTSITIPDSVTIISSNGTPAFYGIKILYYNGSAGTNTETWGAKVRNPAVIEEDFVYLDTEKTQLGLYIGNDSSAEIPNTVTSIGANAFTDCRSLTNITIPTGVTSIGNYAFRGCYSLTSITIPSGVTSIGEYAFGGCTNLTSITIPSGVPSIGYYAFGGCRSLTSIIIPTSVTSIGERAFQNCSALTQATYLGTQAQWSQVTVGSNNEPLTNHLSFTEES